VGQQAEEAAHDRAMRQAWITAALGRTDKMPKIDTLLTQRRKRQTPQEHLAMLRILSQQYGIPMRKVEAHG